MVSCISPTMISLLHVSEHRDTSSSMCALVTSIPKFFFEASTVGETPTAIFNFPLTQNSTMYKHIYKKTMHTKTEIETKVNYQSKKQAYVQCHLSPYA
jgi:hypothetical protein